jgi:hypothetical protein
VLIAGGLFGSTRRPLADKRFDGDAQGAVAPGKDVAVSLKAAQIESRPKAVKTGVARR